MTRGTAWCPTTRFIHYRFFDSDFEQLYRAEERLVKVFGTFLCWQQQLLGWAFFALGLHAVERRGREIGVRECSGSLPAVSSYC
jgi:hypothetical protein